MLQIIEQILNYIKFLISNMIKISDEKEFPA